MISLTRVATLLLAIVAIGCGGAAANVERDQGNLAGRMPNLIDTQALLASDDCSVATVFFGFDSDTLAPSARGEIERAAECMRSGAMPPVHLLGAADPRGTEEYNLALGERRARTVHQYLLSLGVDPTQLTFSSVGEEMARGTNEATWALDRHVAAGGDPEAAEGLGSPRASLR